MHNETLKPRTAFNGQVGWGSFKSQKALGTLPPSAFYFRTDLANPPPAPL